MSALSFTLIGIGAACGAWIRWGLSLLLNPIFPAVPLGTLAANLIGGYLMGIALGTFSSWQHISPEIRSLCTTGFLGGLTTFSAFSAEITTLFLRQQLGLGSAALFVHVGGSLLLTWLGLLTVQLLRG